MVIIKKTGTHNTTYKPGRVIKYIVLHYTAGTRSQAGAAANTAAWFLAADAGGSADFIVDDETFVQYNPDIRDRYCWAVGGSKYGYMSTTEGGRYYNKCTNANSISIEMCSRKTNAGSLGGYDTDWYLSEKTVSNAVELTKYLMQEYKIPAENVIMHHHVTGKPCPNPWCVNEGRLSEWESFKRRIVGQEDDEMVESINMRINGQEIKADAILKDGQTYVRLRSLEHAGFAVGFDTDTKLRTLDNLIKVLPITVNGEDKGIESLNLHNYNFVSLRPLVAMLGFSVEFDAETKTIAIFPKT